ncbi:Cysteine-rich receptor-like protein kinase 29 [Vitis vinifera]|uniref:Cysteine-rich receptor-like protein kinase 29 n=1 Tax=Vitis vinifera TaxID=29760 RepID=A0A438DDN5_VITVI|nr:Cysteine-rich receptor-like protein kinase 29 [Vitis vinifera]
MTMSYLELTFFLSCLLIQLVPFTVAQYFPKEECISDRGDYTDNSTYQTDLNSLLTSFSNTQVKYGFYNFSVGEVNGIGLCRGDLTPDTCRSCINNSSQDIRRLCPNYKEAVLYYDQCTLRYSNRSIFGTVDTSDSYALQNTQNVSDIDLFTQQRDDLLLDLREKAASGGLLKKYATGEAVADFITIYALVQCTPDLEDQECSDCVADLSKAIPIF